MHSCSQFSQNEELREELMKTRGTTLVEAAPRDTVWGIGLSAKNWKAKHREHWRGHTYYYTHNNFYIDACTYMNLTFSTGKNLLGNILTEVREELADDKEAVPMD